MYNKSTGENRVQTLISIIAIKYLDGFAWFRMALCSQGVGSQKCELQSI